LTKPYGEGEAYIYIYIYRLHY